MTPDQIAQLRQKLNKVSDNLQLAEWGHFDNDSAILLEEALALLPCETCNGREKPLSFLRWQSDLREEYKQLGHGYIKRTYSQRQELYQMYVKSFVVCPDCQEHSP